MVIYFNGINYANFTICDPYAYPLSAFSSLSHQCEKRKELKTSEEKNSFTLLHRLIFNLKRILHKIPLVKTKLGTYATALFLLKQHFSDQVEDEEIIEKTFKTWLLDNGYMTEEEINENVMGLGDLLPKGKYKLVTDVVPDTEGDMKAVGNSGDTVVAFSDTSPTDEVLGINIFPVIHHLLVVFSKFEHILL